MAEKQGKGWALVTGASAGIGAAFAERMAQEGYSVVLTARRLDRLTALGQRLRTTFGVDVLEVAADLLHPEAAQKIIETVEAKNIRVAVLFNNAGYGTNGSFAELALERELQMVDVNCKSLVALTHGVVQHMLRYSLRGTIIHTSSVGGLTPTPYFAVYGATKAFIVSFSEALSFELAASGIQVLALCPGVTDSEFGKVAAFRGKTPGRSFSQTARDVADEAVRAIGTAQTRLITGRHNRTLVSLSRFLPRSWMVKLAASSMKPE